MAFDFVPVKFLKEANDYELGQRVIQEEETTRNLEEKGASISEFYRDLVAGPSSTRSGNHNQATPHTQTKTPSERQRRKLCRNPKPSSNEVTQPIGGAIGEGGVLTRDERSFMCAASQGDAKTLSKLVGHVNVNCEDCYGWTSLMCAVQNGHIAAVKFLLDSDCDPHILTKDNLSALHLAQKKKNSQIEAVLLQRMIKRSSSPVLVEPSASSQSDFRPQNYSSCPPSGSEQSLAQPFCKSCDIHYSGTETDHITSISHQMEVRKKMQPHFFIPPSNVGYRLMVKGGWNESKGLGCEGEGRKFPVRTAIKRDRNCLGSGEASRAKVTHFKANDESAVETVRIKPPSHKQGKRDLARKERRERRKVIQFRTLFNMPD